jgi:hypothetical protein
MLLAAALLAVASVVPGAAPIAAAAGTPVVVLRDGTRYVLEKPYEIRGPQAHLTLTGGRLVSIPASEIDVEASKRASAPPPPTPPLTARPAPRSLTIVGGDKTGASSVASSARAVGATPRPTAKSITLSGSTGYSSSGPADSYSAPAGSSSTSFSTSKGGPVQVKGYTRSNGTYVAPHTRSAPSKGGKH